MLTHNASRLNRMAQLISGREDMSGSHLHLWSSCWRQADKSINCRFCGKRQKQKDRDKPFVHSDDCPRVFATDYPWRTLEEIAQEVVLLSS